MEKASEIDVSCQANVFLLQAGNNVIIYAYVNPSIIPMDFFFVLFFLHK